MSDYQTVNFFFNEESSGILFYFFFLIFVVSVLLIVSVCMLNSFKIIKQVSLLIHAYLWASGVCISVFVTGLLNGISQAGQTIRTQVLSTTKMTMNRYFICFRISSVLTRLSLHLRR